MCGGKFALKIDWTNLILGRKFTVFLCFTLYLRAISKYKAPGGYIWRGNLTEGFCLTSLGGLYLKGLIHGYMEGLLGLMVVLLGRVGTGTSKFPKWRIFSRGSFHRETLTLIETSIENFRTSPIFCRIHEL